MPFVQSAGLGACFTVLFATTAAAQATERTYLAGNCDGSAAVMVDSRTLLVANDETNVLHSFDVEGGPAAASAGLADLLDLPDRPGREIDIEAVAQDNDALWWIGSHGRNSSAEVRENRQSLFATNVPGRDLANLHVVHQRVDLIPVLQGAPELASLFHAGTFSEAPKDGGVNIEGLANAGEGRLLVGLRSPLTGPDGTRGDAIAVTIARGQDGWTVEAVDTLPLRDRGIRDIVATDGGYLLIAGSVPSDPDQSLYFWDGASAPVELGISGLDDLNAEALVALGSSWLVLGDHGSVERADRTGDVGECKDIAEDDPRDPAVFFQGVVVTLSN